MMKDSAGKTIYEQLVKPTLYPRAKFQITIAPAHDLYMLYYDESFAQGKN